MVWRPAFLQRFLSRLPDTRSLVFRSVLTSALVAGLFGLALFLTGVQLERRRAQEVAREHAETLAATAGAWLDGDAHAGVGPEPEKRLDDLTSVLETLLEARDDSSVVRTLRPKAEHKAALAAQPDAPRAKALEVVVQTGPGVVRQDVDYTRAMHAALFEGKTVSVLADGRVFAYAPLPDSWGATPALVWVEAPASGPLWRRILVPAVFALLAGSLVSFAVWLRLREARGVAQQLALLGSSLQSMGGGRLPAPLALAAGAPSELRGMADSLEELRQRLESEQRGEPLPLAPESPAQAEHEERLGEATEFDLALLLQQLMDPARKAGRARQVDVQLVYPDGLPSQVVGYPMQVFRGLEAVLGHSLRTTRQGRVSLRVSRAGEGPRGWKLRFEIADTSQGVAFKEQQEFTERLAAAAQADPDALTDPLEVASALAAMLGGELSFESQPGQGSRFGFTVAFAGPPPSATAFRPGPAAALPAPATAFQPRPESTARRARPIGTR